MNLCSIQGAATEAFLALPGVIGVLSLCGGSQNDLAFNEAPLLAGLKIPHSQLQNLYAAPYPSRCF